MVGTALRTAGFGALALLASPAAVIAQPAPASSAAEGRELVSLNDGETRSVGGVDVTARGQTLAILVRSPALASIAVLDGTLTGGGRSAGPGQALVTPTNQPTRRFWFDAARLVASLQPEWMAQAQPSLTRLAAVQRRQRFWGRLEPAGLNASAPFGTRVAAAQANRTVEASAQDRALGAATEQLRLALAYDVAAGIALRTPPEQDALILALATGEGAGDLRARWFMAGAIQQPGSGARTYLYNPLARGWLVLNWAQEGAAWRIASARLVSSGMVGWMGGNRPYLAGLVADYAATHAQPGAEPGDLAGMEADRWITGLAEFMHDPARLAAANEAKGLIARGRTARLGGGAIDMMPERARASYAPIAGFERAEGGRSLLFGSPLYPQILIAADFDGAARPALTRITLVNLDNAGRGQ